jgi:hypothetical protein
MHLVCFSFISIPPPPPHYRFYIRRVIIEWLPGFCVLVTRASMETQIPIGQAQRYSELQLTERTFRFSGGNCDVTTSSRLFRNQLLEVFM